jgi:hypothetical protein
MPVFLRISAAPSKLAWSCGANPRTGHPVSSVEPPLRVPTRANAIFHVTEKVSRYLLLLFGAEADGITCQTVSG